MKQRKINLKFNVATLFVYCPSFLQQLPPPPQKRMMASSPVPRPKSPPELYGKRRELAKVVMLEREIGFLQEELKSIETIKPVSSCIKEVADYVVTAPEPLITVSRKTPKSCGFWKWLLCGNWCCNISCVCCEMPQCCKTPNCCCCVMPNCCKTAKFCSLPKCSCACFKPPSCPSCLKPCFCCPKCDSSCCPDCGSCCKCSCFSCWPTKCNCSCPKCCRCGCFSLENICCC
ncbi:hypothetical protein SSX86_009759 [Deinandra increscens subsp. villosa]|uniref:G protein gamma domain-containing protein n=1 Tax=Deinandra increscens subsp. villosa TaxID=3103831 RepID=A0AAP0H3Q8_9ASTR